MGEFEQTFWEKYKLNIIYSIFIIFLWIWQVLDWQIFKRWHDPIWHLLFYLAIIPFITFIFWIIIWNKSKWWQFSIFSMLAVILIFLLFANWWLKIWMNLYDLFQGALIFIIGPTFLAAIVWVGIAKLWLFIRKLLKKRK